MRNSIVYNLVESNVLRMYEELVLSSSYNIIDKLELEDELEFSSNNCLFVYSYEVELDSNEYYLVIVVEEDRVLYSILDREYSRVEETIIINGEDLNYTY